MRTPVEISARRRRSPSSAPPRGPRGRATASSAEIDWPIDLVDVFRRPEFTPAVAAEAVAARAGALWLQLGVVSAEARRIAESGGLDYVEDLCTAVVHRYEVRDAG